MRTRTGTYGGRTVEQRRADRRERLVDAACEIWGDQGWAAVTMRGVCARAELTDRYFYESFTDRDALLVAVWDQVRDRLVELTTTAMFATRGTDPIARLRAAIAAVVHHFDNDPRQTRIVLGDNAGSPDLERRRRDSLQTFTELLVRFARPYLAPGADENALRMTTLMGVGGFVELITAWRNDLITADAEEIIDHAAEVGASLGARYLAPVPRGLHSPAPRSRIT